MCSEFLKRAPGAFCVGLAWMLVLPTFANIPGGGTGTGPNVTLTDTGSTVTLNNGIVSILVTKSDASIHTLNYTFNNTGTSQTLNLLSGGNNGGQLYWTGNPASFGNMSFTEAVVTNTADYAEIALLSTTATNGTMEVHYSMLRGSPGFYTAVILSHRPQDATIGIVLRPNIYSGSIFNWMSVDAARNRLMEVSGGSAIGVQGAPKECSLWTNGLYAGQYEDKYKYSAMLGQQRAWGWSSVGSGGKNVGLWNLSASVECYPGGPMERSLMEHLGTTILNVFTGGYYGLATDNNIQSGETWSKVYGPYFYYCNNVTNALTGTNAPAQALYQDALDQAAAEATAWPYTWFANTNYVAAANRGTVTGKMVIDDSGSPNASAAGLWVGVVQQPSPAVDPVYDFQQWCRPYEFWVQTDVKGNFSIPDVIAGTNYTLYAFGPGAPGLFLSQTQNGGNPPLLYDLPTVPFSVAVPANGTNNLGAVTWTPARVGATVFEIGYPDRTAAKFRHGDDYWVGDIGPSASAPSPIWSKWLEYPFDFPNGVNYVVGQSRWSTDWNFCQPVVTDTQGNYNASSSTITFTLPSTPTNGATASLYLGLCSDYYAAIIVSVNGVNVATLSGLSAKPITSVPSSGYYTAYGSSDTTIREGNNGAFTDERLTFPATALHAGANTITIGFRQIAASYFANHFMYDYLRLELTGYIPPAPPSVVAYPGNNCNLVCWPVTPGATSYNILRSTTSGSGSLPLTNGVTGPVCGSGTNNALYLDTTAVNGTAYYYVVQSVNPTGASANSPPSSGASPSASLATGVPAAPAGLTVSSVGHHTVTLTWNASPGANYYSVFRSTMVNNGGGASNTLSTILLNNALTNTTYTDSSPTDGVIYQYFVTATSAGGASANSSAVVGRAIPAAPSLPVSLVGSFVSTNTITLNWQAVPGAVGYVITRATSASGPYVYLQTVTETTYTDTGLNPNTIYYYRVAAMNAGSVSPNVTDSVNYQQPPPTSLSATATNGQVTLAWSPATNATSYTVKRGISTGSETTIVVSGYTGTTYTNTALANGTTYYYVVTASGPGGASGNSPEASATPLVNGDGVWIATTDGNWGTAANWNAGAIASGSGSTADFSTLGLTSNLTVNLDSARTISGMTFGDLNDAYGWTLVGTNPLTLGASPSVNVVNQSATFAVPLAGTNGLSKSGAGALTLTASNAFTGGLNINSGSLMLAFSSKEAPTANLVSSANSLSLAGGALQITGSSNAPSSQSFAGLTLNEGASSLAAAPASGSTYPTVNLGTLAETVGGTVEFSGPATINSVGAVPASATITTTTSPGSGGVVGGLGLGKNGAYATVGLYDWATTNTATSPYTVVGGSQVPGFYQTAGVTSAGNYDVNSGGVNSIGNGGGASTLRFNQNAALTINNTAFTWQNCQGILVTPNCGAHNETISGVSLQFYRSTSPGRSYGVIWQNNTLGYLNCSIPLGSGRQAGQNNGLVQSGPGTVVYTGANSYELGAYLNGGFSVVSGYNGFGQAGNGYTTVSPVTLNGGTMVANATFTNSQAGANGRPFILGNHGGGLAATAGNTMTVDGLISGAGPLTIGIAGSSVNDHTAGLLPGSGPGTANPTAVYATGTVVLTGANSYTGGTVLQSGTLSVNNATGSATGPGEVRVQNQGVLTGNGVVSGSVAVAEGGSLMPGAFNVLDIGGDLTLSGGATTTLSVQPSPATNSAVNVGGTLLESGTLVVSNLGSSDFTAGDRFQLLSANDFAGAFSNVVLPSLPSNTLSWNTSQLNVDGSLWVVSTTPPSIAQLSIVETNLVLSGSGGTPNWNYYLLATTNLAMPLSQWTVLGANAFDAAGNFSCTNTVDAGDPQLYLRLESQ